MKNTMRKAMLSTIAMLVVAVMSLTGVTYAWFTAGEQATVTGMDMTVTAAEGGIEVSLDGQTGWKQVLDLGATLDKADIKPLSSVNGEDFYNGVFSTTDSTKLITTKATSDEVTANVITVDLYLRTTNPAGNKVTLDGTYFSDIKKGELAATEIGKAARMAILDKDGNLKGIIAPYGVVSATDGKATITNAAESYVGISGASAAEGFDNTAILSDVAETVTTKVSSAIEIDLAGYTTGTAGAATKITVVIWLEGQDGECINPNANGAFNTYLNFKKK